MDIATLLESHRQLFRENIAYYVEKNEDVTERDLLWAHDQATTKVALDLHRAQANGEAKPLGQAALTTPPPTPSKRVKAGSKEARTRALKAGETRRKNLAAKQQNSGAGGSGSDGAALSPATHLVPRPPEGGAA